MDATLSELVHQYLNNEVWLSLWILLSIEWSPLWNWVSIPTPSPLPSKDATSDSSGTDCFHGLFLDNEATIHTHTAGQKRINSLLLLASAPIQAPIVHFPPRFWWLVVEPWKIQSHRMPISCSHWQGIQQVCSSPLDGTSRIVWKGNKRLQTNYQQVCRPPLPHVPRLMKRSIRT